MRGGKATIVWHSPAQARPLLLQAIEAYVKDCTRLAAALDPSFGEAAVRSKVRIWIRDQRKSNNVPIPAVPGIEFNVCAPIQHASRNGRCVD